MTSADNIIGNAALPWSGGVLDDPYDADNVIGNSIARAAELFGWVINGNVPYYTEYTRAGDATAELPDGTPVTVAQDTPPYEYVGGQKLFRQYEGTNLTLYSEDLREWLLSPLAVVEFGESSPDGKNAASRITVSGTATIQYRLAVNENTDYVFSFYAKNNGGTDANYSVFDWTNVQNIIAQTSYFSELSETNFSRIVVPFTTPNGCNEVGVYVERDTGTALDAIIWGTMVNVGNVAVPYVKSEVTQGTHNPGTTALQINDIETGAYEFNGTSDHISRESFSELSKAVDFSIDVSIYIANSAASQMILSNVIATDDRLSMFINGNVLSVGIYNGVDWLSKSGPILVGKNVIKVIYEAGNLTVHLNGELLTGSIDPTSTATAGFTIGARTAKDLLFFSGAIWQIKFYDALSNLFAYYPLTEYRRDTFIPDESGNGNHGTSARTVDNLLVENQGFGVIGEDARKPFTYTYADGGMFMGGLRELFYGSGDGADLWQGPEQVVNGGWTSLGNNRYFCGGTQTAVCHLIKTDNVVNIGDRGEVRFVIEEITAGNVYLRFGTGGAIGASSVGEYTERMTAATQQNRLTGSTDFVGTVRIEYVREVSPAIGTILFKNLTLHDTTTDVTLLEGQNGTAVVWLDSATSKIKITDGTNTAESANTVTQGVNIPELRIVLNETEMWITDSAQGTKVTFVGYLPELGNRALAVSDSEYLTVSDVLVSDGLDYYVLYDGDDVLFDGESLQIEYK